MTFRSPEHHEKRITMASQFNLKDYCTRCNHLFEDIQYISEMKYAQRYLETCVSKSGIQEADYQFKVKCYNYGVFSTGPASLDARMVGLHRERTKKTLRTLMHGLELCMLWKSRMLNGRR